MSWPTKHPVETLAEWGAPALFAIAAGWSVSAAALPLAAVMAAATIAFATGVVVMRLAGAAPIAVDAGFDPVPIEDAAQFGELLLDDPLVEIADDSRVVQLFAKPEPTPGELVLKIQDYLSDDRRPQVVDGPAEAFNPPADASASLHAALANIRASLR